MNANGQRFWMLSDERHWSLWGEPRTLQYHDRSRSLRLRSYRALPKPAEEASEAVASARVDRVRQVVDPLGSRAYWHEASGTVRARSPRLPGEVEIFRPAEAIEVQDLAVSEGDVLCIAASGRILLHDLRGRFEDLSLTAEDFDPFRLAALPGGGLLALDRENRKLGRVRGFPLPERPEVTYDPTTWRPEEENPNPPRLEIAPLPVPENERPVAIATSLEGRLALLTWSSEGNSRLYLRDPEAVFDLLHDEATPLKFAYSLGFVSASRIAALIVGIDEAPVFDVTAGGEKLLPVGDVYPIRDHDGGPLANGLVEPVHYALAPGESVGLHPLSLPAFAKSGRAANYDAAAPGTRWPLDSGSVNTIWHRLYLDAVIPRGCSLRVYLASTETSAPPSPDAPSWHEHRFGDLGSARDRVPRGAWVPLASEVPFHPGLVPCEPEKDRAGLFTVLVSRSGLRVTSLRGRYLWVRVELGGNGRETPELYGLRAYASRFSYVENYLPELYQETEFGPEAHSKGPPTRADFLERFLDNFEGTLTTIEDRIASSFVLTDARGTPSASLPWLASWLGLDLEPGYPERLRRALLELLPELYRSHGTLYGLELALNIATGGSVERGGIVVVENFRLARTFATILGADLADEDDPLLAGLVESGNSYVGDTLVLGDETRREFLAVFRPDEDERDEEAVRAFLEGLAYRVTIFVRQDLEPQDLGLIRRLVIRHAPAHVQVRIVPASDALRVGLSSLVGVDTYLREESRRPVELERSFLGVKDFITGSGALDPRIGGGSASPVESRRPEAAGEDARAELGESFELRGSRSRAFGGRRLEWYRWTWVGRQS